MRAATLDVIPVVFSQKIHFRNVLVCYLCCVNYVVDGWFWSLDHRYLGCVCVC